MDQDGLVVTHLVDAMIEIHIIGIIGEDRAPPMVGGVTIMTPMEDTGIVLCLPGVGAIPELIDFIVFIFFSCFCLWECPFIKLDVDSSVNDETVASPTTYRLFLFLFF